MTKVALVFAAVLGCATLALFEGGRDTPTVHAEIDCSDQHRLRIEIVHDNTGLRLDEDGSEVHISPAPREGDGTTEFEDGEGNDDADATGRIDIDNACEMTSSGSPDEYSITVQDLPEDCDVVGSATRTTTLTSDETLTFRVRNCEDDGGPDNGGGSNVPASLGFPQANCAGSLANVTFYWGSNNSGLQFLDLTLIDNNFASGTFVSSGALSSGTGRFTWNGLVAGRPHFWRVNTLTDSGWVTSSSGTFVPCGAPQVRGITYACIGGGQAAVTFHWSPATPAGSTTWLDLSIFNNGFAGAFVNAGPMGHDWLNFTWFGILANQQHYWRVSSLFGGDWARSSTGTFVAFC
jgi:hypothetical protein